jgi:integrase
MATENIEVKEVQHRGQQVLLILFAYDEKLIEQAKELGAKFTITHRGWWLPNTKENKDKIEKHFKLERHAEEVKIAEAPLAEPTNIELPQEYIDTLHRRRYSPNTVKTYLNFFTQFAAHIQPKPVHDAEEADIKAFLLYLVKERNLGYSSQNQAVNAIKFYFEQVLHEERKTYWIDRPIKDKKLPQVLSEEEVAQMLGDRNNLKHWLVVA